MLEKRELSNPCVGLRDIYVIKAGGWLVCLWEELT